MRALSDLVAGLERLGDQAEALNEHSLARVLEWLRVLYQRDGHAQRAEPFMAALVAPPEKLAMLVADLRRES